MFFSGTLGMSDAGINEFLADLKILQETSTTETFKESGPVQHVKDIYERISGYRRNCQILLRYDEALDVGHFRFRKGPVSNVY